MSIKICSCSPRKREETLLWKSVSTLYNPDIREHNTKPLAECYNEFLNTYSSYDWVVLVHDDVFIRDSRLEQHLEESPFDIVGLAGCKSIELKEPALWHLMSKREDWAGAVAHPVNADQYFITSFGPMPNRCLLVDGLFMAVRMARLPKEVRFDTSNPGKWHHYDLDFCLTANAHKLRIGVSYIPVIHNSPGLSSLEDPAFKLSQKWFLQKWS